MNFFGPVILLVQNILTGTRAALFMPMHLWSFRGSLSQILLLLLVSFCLSLLYDYFDSLPDNYFNPYGLTYQAMLYLSFFFSLTLIAYLKSRQRDLEKLIIMFLSVVPVIWLGTICMLELGRWQSLLNPYQTSWAVFLFYSIWYLLVALRLFKRFFYISWSLACLYVFLYAVINFSPLFLLPSQPLWESRPDADQHKEITRRLDIESIYYKQNILLEEITDNLLAERKDNIDMYFIGFAGDAEEDVFMNELLAAKNIIESEFNIFGRTVSLINNKKTVDKYPLANQYNLKRAIKNTGDKMNLDEDILFLFLTSHGTEDHSISSQFHPFKLKDIGPEKIKDFLDEAKIKWRVIVISACYSGGFVKPLSSPGTLIITAARGDRNSFGCGHDGRFTYFGEAFFAEALYQTKSFINAFDVAKEIISKKEEAQGVEKSEPQISIGTEIEQQLTKYNRQLTEKDHANWAITNQPVE